ncbi:MAG: hypothetical protein M3R39_10050, partial [Actinomycetota bacterium]|nr:hypothetical protein [Actinomycetota bacterium]
MESGGACRRLEPLAELAADLADVDRFDPHGLGSIEPSEAPQVRNECCETLAFGGDRPRRFLALSLVAGRSVGESVGEAGDGIDRGRDFVRDIGEEFPLLPVGRLEARGHPVEGAPEAGELWQAGGSDPRAEVPRCDTIGGGDRPFDRLADRARNQRRRDSRCENHERDHKAEDQCQVDRYVLRLVGMRNDDDASSRERARHRRGQVAAAGRAREHLAAAAEDKQLVVPEHCLVCAKAGSPCS